jgi:RNA polymerase sigma factor for flagellar operon FliA
VTQNSETPLGPAARGALLDAENRDALAVRHLDLVNQVVGRLRVALPPSLDRDDLLAAGVVGLLQAARSFEPDRGASFRTFATIAIRASVLDELRRHDPLPRGARKRLRALREVEARVLATSGRLPTPEEIGAELGLPVEECEALLAQDEEYRILEKASRGASDEGLPEIPDPLALDPSARAERQEALAQVEVAIRSLPERERQVVLLYHAEGFYLREIAEVLGVTESRVCQILAAAEKRIRACFTREEPERGTEER